MIWSFQLWSVWCRHELGCLWLARWVVEMRDQLPLHPIINKMLRGTQMLACTSLNWQVQLPWPEWCKTSSYWSLCVPMAVVHADKQVALYWQSLTVCQTEWRWLYCKRSWLSISHCSSGSHQHTACCFTAFDAPSFLSPQGLSHQHGLQNVWPPTASNFDVKIEMHRCPARF